MPSSADPPEIPEDPEIAGDGSIGADVESAFVTGLVAARYERRPAVGRADRAAGRSPA